MLKASPLMSSDLHFSVIKYNVIKKKRLGRVKQVVLIKLSMHHINYPESHH